MRSVQTGGLPRHGSLEGDGALISWGALPALPRIGNVTRRPATRRGGPSGHARPLVVAADAVLRRGAAVLTDEEARQIRSRPKDVWTAADRDALLRLLAARAAGLGDVPILGFAWLGDAITAGMAHVVAAPQSATFIFIR